MKVLKRITGMALAVALVFSLTACNSGTAQAAHPDTSGTGIPLAASKTSSFSDVSTGAWYFEAVEWCRENGIMSGVSDTAFQPDATLTRAMIAAVLYRMEKEPAVTNAPDFTDTAPGAWYANAVSWAAVTGTMSGYGNGVFGPDDAVTREQLATILWRYSGEPAAENGTFQDRNAVSAYALTAMDWAASTGLLRTDANGSMNPRNTATRAEVAYALYKNFSVVKVACVGDSFAEGYGGIRYPDALTEILGTGYEVKNFGIGGATAMTSGTNPYTSHEAYQDSLQYDADVVILSFGTNDSNRRSWKGKETFQKQYDELVQSYLEMDSAPAVYLCTPVAAYSTEYGIQPSHYDDIIEAIQAVAQAHDLPVIDLNTLTSNHSDWYHSDGIHLNQDGADQAAEVISKAIKQDGGTQYQPVPAEVWQGAAYNPDIGDRQVILLWDEGNIPTITTASPSGYRYADSETFRPNLIVYPVDEGTPVKGAVMVVSGGAFQVRSNINEGDSVARALNKLGYQCFVVNYRIRPYTQEEGALDLARAVRYVRSHAAEYGIDENDIAVVGFSAGGILCGEMLLNYDGTVNGTALDKTYVPDALDQVSADAAAVGMIYSFYGRLSVSNNDVATLKAGDLPPAFYAYGTEDPFYRQFIQNADAVRDAGVAVEEHVFDGQPHGFGAGSDRSDWIPLFDEFLTNIFGRTGGGGAMSGNYTRKTPIQEVIDAPAFGEYGRLIFPVDSGYYSGNTLEELRLTWYTHIDPDKTVEIANDLKGRASAGEPVFYDIYTDAEKAADPDKEDTGLFFFKGNPGEKFAVCNAGGGFAYVGAMQDSFPHALELSKQGYNAFALIYRPGWQTAYEDLGRAIQFIFDHADELEVDTDGYSLWGGSAGARMAATLGNASYLKQYTGRNDIPQAAAVIMQYTGYDDASANDAPTYVCVGTNDGIANWRGMEQRLNTLTNTYGVPTEFHAYNGLPHGFGLGTGTIAEGWLDDAVDFWEAQSQEEST